MAPRLELHELLKDLLGSSQVYFQQPASMLLQYPAIVYNRDDVTTRFADNLPYERRKRYLVTVIDQDPDSDIPDKVGELPTAVHDRFFTADNLNHDVFRLYF